jgi:hypothetical protein
MEGVPVLSVVSQEQFRAANDTVEPGLQVLKFLA